MKFKIEHYYIVVGSLVIFLPQLVEGQTQGLLFVKESQNTDATPVFAPSRVTNKYDTTKKTTVDKMEQNTQATLKTTPQWLTTWSPENVVDNNALVVTLLPPSINLSTEAPTNDSLKLRWKVAPRYGDYPLLNYSLHVKANSHAVPNVSTYIDAQCTEFNLGRNNSNCGVAYTILPCTQYDFELAPVYANYSGPFAGTTTTYYTPFPSEGDYLGLNVIDYSGAQWPKLNLTLHPQCLPYVDSLKVTLSYGNSLTNLSVSGDCLMKHHVNGTRTTILNLGDSECFPNFRIFKDCAIRYFVRALYILALNSSETLGIPREIEAGVVVAHDWINIPKVAVQELGADWIFATWEPPACPLNSLNFKGYEMALYEKDRTDESCFMTLPEQTSMNLSRAISCNNGERKIGIQPCIVYYIKIKPHFVMTDLDSHAKWTHLNDIHTSPKLSSFVLDASATNLSAAWGDVAQNARCVSKYELRLFDESIKVKDLSVPNNKFSYTFTNLTPCTIYEVHVDGISYTGDVVVWTIGKYSTLELGPEIPLKLNYTYWNDAALNLTWVVPQEYAKCTHSYLIEIAQTVKDGMKLYLVNQTTNVTKFDFCCLEYDTVYEVNVTACTFRYSCQTMPTNIFINGRTGNIRPAATVAMIILFSLCTAFLIMLAYWCYVTQRWRTCLAFCSDTKGESIRRRRPSYSRANEDDIEEIGARKKSHGINRQSLKHSMRSYVANRPIGMQDFEKALAVLMADTCALLSEEYEDIKMLSNEKQPKTQAMKQENKAKNRYVNILPYDHSRVPLNCSHEDGTEDYINASYIQVKICYNYQLNLTGFNGAKEYIAAQGPKPATISDFWRMIWEQDVRILVMVTQLEEQGRIKCAQYWPDSSQVLSYGAITISQVLQVDMNDYIIREFEVQNDGSKRTVTQMHFLKWPDFGCPANPETLLSFVEAVRDRVFSLSAGEPTLVHCSAGVGRTGTFIAVDWLVQEAQVSREIDIFSTVLKLRSDRMNMVQTEDQYLFIYQCLAHFMKTRLREGHPLPSNREESQVLEVDMGDHPSRPPSGIVRQTSEVETNM